MDQSILTKLSSTAKIEFLYFIKLIKIKIISYCIMIYVTNLFNSLRVNKFHKNMRKVKKLIVQICNSSNRFLLTKLHHMMHFLII